jgi:hypothetical protein
MIEWDTKPGTQAVVVRFSNGSYTWFNQKRCHYILFQNILDFRCHLLMCFLEAAVEVLGSMDL